MPKLINKQTFMTIYKTRCTGDNNACLKLLGNQKSLVTIRISKNVKTWKNNTVYTTML
jgi:hypothetical protein